MTIRPSQVSTNQDKGNPALKLLVPCSNYTGSTVITTWKETLMSFLVVVLSGLLDWRLEYATEEGSTFDSTGIP